MFDIGFWELIVIAVVGLLVLGPERLPVAVRTVSRLFKAVRDTANTVKTELSQELRIDELNRDLKKAESLDIKHLNPELLESVDQLKDAVASVARCYENKAQPEFDIELKPKPKIERNIVQDREQKIPQDDSVLSPPASQDKS
ncbi:Sec-independent protein translocase protein TatB [Oceanisphaera sp. IT1-181]|uniref:Sec-independent protein translocase protein TatB n=1 Tax=Oceanisphaera sp. IT1-181 TaxID=3081199 RepID=UPI0029CA2621|nr:Sec-independent protein translocase protein TatB [Oceanisphaera sp. IT1-181]